MPDVALVINGKDYAGWQEVKITRGIEQMAGTFDLTVTERWSGQESARPVYQGQECVVSIDGDPIITGYVDDTMPSFDKDTHTLQIVGRDKTADLVDCSAKSGEWKNRDVLRIAKAIAAPFNIEVIASADVGAPLKKFSIQEGETAFEAIERACRFRALLPISDTGGRLVLTQAGESRIKTPLIQGENILTGQGTFSFRDRFSKITVKGHSQGSDWSTPGQNSGPSGSASDPGIKRYRPLIIIAEEPGGASQYRTRALWEAAVRMGKSARPTVSVQGWRYADGLWMPNNIVAAKIPYFNLDADMLIVSVTYRIDDHGTIAELELSRPDAFKLIPVPEKSEDGLWN